MTHITLRARLIIIATVLLPAAAASRGQNLLTNADFSRKTEAEMPAAWTVVKGQKVSVDDKEAPEGVKQSLRVDVVEDGGSSYGQAYQNVKAKPNTIYRLEGKTKSTKAGLAFLSYKLLKDGKEVKRVGLPKSEAKWTAASGEISTGDADVIQVLCRWEQNAQRGWVGQTGWFGDVKLVEVGAAPPPPPWTEAIRRAAQTQPATAPALPLKPADADIYVTPDGAGTRDGTSWDNALPGNSPGAVQAAWDALAPGRACRLGSGVYANVALTISSGGTGADKMKRLVGVDTGRGLPWLVGNWDPNDVAKGATFLALANEVDYCSFEDLRLARYQNAIYSKQGRHVGLRVRNLRAYEMRFGIYLNGFALVEDANLASHDLEIRDCEFIHFTKSAVRLQGGNYDVRLINCVADAGGQEWMKESFHMCFAVCGDHPRRLFQKDANAWASEHDIIFVNCVARNPIYSKDRYWQGDGFLAESCVRNVAYVNCESYDCADGGWDNKARNVVYVNCVSMRSKMNFRVWQQGFFYNCLSAYSLKRGGTGSSAGLWTLGEVRADHCTLHNNEAQQVLADAKGQAEANVALTNCLVSFDGANSQTERLYAGESRVTRTDTAEWRAKTDAHAGAGDDPEYVSAATAKAWAGKPPDAFDSKRYAASKGFHSSVCALWRAKDADRLVEIARALLKNTGPEDFLRQVQAVK